MKMTYRIFAVTVDEAKGLLTFLDRTGKRHSVKVTHDCAVEINHALQNGKGKTKRPEDDVAY